MTGADVEGPRIVGREAELATVMEFLTTAEAGFGALVLEGEAGIGKTAVWLETLALARKRGMRVLSTRTAPAETAYSFAGLGDLAEGAIEHVADSLPAPQRLALDVALLRAPSQPRAPGSRTVAAAVLNLLRALSTMGPLIVAIDDMQWLDRSSFAVLGFATRRLGPEPVRLFCTMRAGEDSDTDLTRAIDPRRVQRLDVGALSLGALHHVLLGELGTSVSRPLLLQIHEVSGGNPFFAIEMARALATTGTGDQPGRQLSVPESLSVLVRGRLADLSPRVREALLHVAAMARPERSVLERELPERARAAESLRRAAEARVLVFEGDRIRFSHPLLGSVLYSDAPAAERRRVHRRLATAVSDPEERALHLALATPDRDAGVATILEEAAGQARSRGATAAAASLSRHALRLTPPGDRVDAWRRTGQTAEYLFVAGEGAEARDLLRDLAEAMPPGPERGEILWRLARMRHEGYDFKKENIELFGRALAELPEDHPSRAPLLNVLAWAELHEGHDKAMDRAIEAVRASELAGNPGQVADSLASVGFFACIRGLREDEERAFERALALEPHVEGLYVDERPSWVYSVSLMFHDRFDEARERMHALIAEALDLGEENSLPTLRFRLSLLESWAGNWRAAEEHADLGHDAAVQTDQRVAAARLLHARALVHTLQGRHELAREEATRSLAEYERNRQPASVKASARGVLGFVALSEGDAAGAVEELGAAAEAFRRVGVGEPGVHRIAADLAEALIGTGDLAAATSVIAELEEQGRRLDRAYALATGARCRALLQAAGGDLEPAGRSVEKALRHHERLPQPFELARTLLAAGRIHRRSKRKRDARDSLTRAAAIFDGLGSPVWARRASEELARIGGRAPAQELTETERRVAELVAEGRSNKEVAATLFVSAKTVEASLTRIYGKLGVRSRMELARRILGPRA
jgi:DNA-binding CsgD family transcriptional regulator